MNDYELKQLEIRKMQEKYSSIAYTYPDTYREKNEAYTKEFNAGPGLKVGFGNWFYRTHGMKDGTITIGSNVIISNHCTIDFSGEVIIGDNVIISDDVRIYSHKHDTYKLTHGIPNNVSPKRTVIKKNAWLGEGSLILPGITVGEYAVVGAGSVVTHDVPDNTIVAGNPAIPIGMNAE